MGITLHMQAPDFFEERTIEYTRPTEDTLRAKTNLIAATIKFSASTTSGSIESIENVNDSTLIKSINKQLGGIDLNFNEKAALLNNIPKTSKDSWKDFNLELDKILAKRNITQIDHKKFVKDLHEAESSNTRFSNIADKISLQLTKWFGNKKLSSENYPKSNSGLTLDATKTLTDATQTTPRAGNLATKKAARSNPPTSQKVGFEPLKRLPSPEPLHSMGEAYAAINGEQKNVHASPKNPSNNNFEMIQLPSNKPSPQIGELYDRIDEARAFNDTIASDDTSLRTVPLNEDNKPSTQSRSLQGFRTLSGRTTVL